MFLGQTTCFPDGEMLFWLQIMADHAMFIKESLDPEEQNLLLVAENFIKIFNRFSEKSRQISTKESEGFFNEVISGILSLRDFKRELLVARLKNMPVTALSPTFYNHMLNELEELLKITEEKISGVRSTSSILKDHLLWSLDAASHAGFIKAGLDKVEHKLIQDAELFQNDFDRLYLKAVEICGFLRGDFSSVQPVIATYNCEVIEIMRNYLAYLEALKEGIIKQKVLGRFSLLEPDHMWREGNYYLGKIILEVGCDMNCGKKGGGEVAGE